MLLAVSALLLAFAVGFLTYALWPRKRTDLTYVHGGDENPLAVLYTRSAHGWFERWNQRWEHTGGRAKTPKRVGQVMLAVAAVVFALVTVLSLNPVVAAVVTAAAVSIPWFILGAQSKKREQVITVQLVDFLDAVRSGLETGTPEVAIRQAATSVDAPLAHELSGLVSDLDARVNLSDALRNLAARNSSRAMAFTCATLDMAKQTGSTEINTNLSELAKLIRNNERTAEDIKNKTLILRVSAKLFVIVPALTMLFSVLGFGLEPWLTIPGLIGFCIIVVVSVGSTVGFRKLQQWQVGL